MKNSANRIVLGLGSNLGSKAHNLLYGVKSLHPLVKVLAVSSVYTTKSLLRDAQDRYFNICALCTTELDPLMLLDYVKSIEKRAGRTPSPRWHSRILDIDIIDYNRSVYSFDNLEIPHPEMDKRSFVLYPMLDILPDYTHPVSCRTLTEMVKLIDDKLEIQKAGELAWR